MKLVNFKDFKMVRPPEFRRTTELIEAQSWIKEMEKAYRVGNEQKTIFAMYMLKGVVDFWWETNRNRAGARVITWERFK